MIKNNIMNKSENIKGFTVLELLVVVAIIATTLLFAYPTLQTWNNRKSLKSSVNDFYSAITEVRMQAMARSTTTRVLTSASGDDYTFTSYYLPTASSSCDASDPNWVQIKSQVIEINTNFQVTGSGLGNICFFRDGSATTGSFSFDEKDGGTDLGSADIDVIMATGFVDYVIN